MGPKIKERERQDYECTVSRTDQREFSVSGTIVVVYVVGTEPNAIHNQPNLNAWNSHKDFIQFTPLYPYHIILYPSRVINISYLRAQFVL